MLTRKPRRKADTPLKAPLAYGNKKTNLINKKKKSPVKTFISPQGRGILKSRKHQAIPEYEPLGNTVEQSDYARISSRHVQLKSKFQPRSTNSIWPQSSPPPSSAAGEAERVGHDILGQARPSPLQTGLTPIENSSDSSDHDDIWDFTSSSSVPSPEIFRDDSDTSTFDFSGEADPLDMQQDMQQPCSSTLLSSSHAENIGRHQPPNVSAILVNSSADKPLEGTSLKSAVAKRPISYRKARPFKTPLVPSRPREKPNFSPPMFFQYSDREEFFRQVRERADRLKSFRLSLRPSVP